MTYPKWVQRTPDLGPILAANEDEEAVYASMGQPDADPAEGDAEGHTVESVRAALDAAGVKYDRRLGLEKLKALLPA